MIIINILDEKKQHGLYSILHMENCTSLISLETTLIDHPFLMIKRLRGHLYAYDRMIAIKLSRRWGKSALIGLEACFFSKWFNTIKNRIIQTEIIVKKDLTLVSSLQTQAVVFPAEKCSRRQRSLLRTVRPVCTRKLNKSDTYIYINQILLLFF